MTTVETKNGKHKVKFYDSIRKLPIMRYQKFNKYMMIGCEVGDSVQDYDNRTDRAIRYLNAGDATNAGIELENRRQLVHHAMSEYSPKGNALAIMVHSIDGRVIKDFEDETLEAVLKELDSIGFTIEMLNETIGTVKKK